MRLLSILPCKGPQLFIVGQIQGPVCQGVGFDKEGFPSPTSAVLAVCKAACFVTTNKPQQDSWVFWIAEIFQVDRQSSRRVKVHQPRPAD